MKKSSQRRLSAASAASRPPVLAAARLHRPELSSKLQKIEASMLLDLFPVVVGEFGRGCFAVFLLCCVFFVAVFCVCVCACAQQAGVPWGLGSLFLVLVAVGFPGFVHRSCAEPGVNHTV